MISKSLADQLTAIAIKQLEIGQRFKEPRIKEIQKSEDLYLNKTKPALKGRFNVPLPIMGGFVDTLMSKIDDPPRVNFNPTEEADSKKSKKVTAAWTVDASSERGDWAIKDLDCKKLAIFSGRGIFKYFAESDPEYSSKLDVVDYYDFICEPQGGADLENHLFCGQINIFKTKEQLKEGAEKGVYDKQQVFNLINNAVEGETRQTQEDYQHKNNRLRALGLDTDTNNYVGQQLYNLVEWCMVYNGKRYYLLFDPKPAIWVRAEELMDVFASDLYPFVSWATHRDPFNFWSKGPCDDQRPVAELSHIIINQALANIQKRNFGQRAYDSSIFPDPSQLEYRPDGLASAKVPPGKTIRDGIYEFDTPDVTTTLNVFSLLDNLTGQKTGVTASAQGQSEKDQKVGIYYGDLQQVADRLGLYNKYYRKAWASLGLRYYEGLKEHMPEKMMVKMIGEKGVEWEELTKDDLKPTKDFDITITGGNAESEADEVLKKTKSEALARIEMNPTFASLVSPRWLLQQDLRNAGFEEEDIRVALDVQNEGNQEIMAEAAQENQDMVLGKEVEPNRGATTAHLQKHLDFTFDKKLKPEVVQRIMAHFQQEVPIASQNKVRKTMNFMAQQAQPQQPIPQQGMPQQGMENNIPNTIQGTASRSQQLSNMLLPNE